MAEAASDVTVDGVEGGLAVSVIIPTYGRRARLQHLLRGLCEQDTRPETYEIIVVDDGSPEPAIDPRGRNPGPPLLTCHRKEHAGPAVARDYGARRARGRYLVFVDDDMSVGRDFLRAHLKAHQAGGPWAVNCAFDWDVQAEPPPFERWYRRQVAEWTRAREAALRPLGDGLFGIPNVLLTTANLSLSRADYLKAGGFDHGYPFSCEDQDFGLRLARMGVRGLVTALTKAIHVETHNTLRKQCHRQEMGAQDTVRFIRRFSVVAQVGQPAIATVNDPLRLGIDPWRLAAKKTMKTLVVLAYLAPLVFGLVYLWERIAPGSSWLQRAYDLVVGAHFGKGWRRGLRLYATEPPLPEFAPSGPHAT